MTGRVSLEYAGSFTDDEYRELCETQAAEYHFNMDGGSTWEVVAGETAWLGQPISATEIREIVAGLS